MMIDQAKFVDALAAKYGQVVANNQVYGLARDMGLKPPHWFFRLAQNAGRGRWRVPGAPAPEAAPTETDAQVDARIRERFAVMADMADATLAGDNRAVIVSGPPGVGKSHGVMRSLEALGDDVKWTVVKGFVRPTGLYKTLYEHREPGSVVVFDDADSVFFDDVSLNILKSACDTTRTRRLSWLAETRMEDEEGERLPRSFVFEGSVVFITNYDFDAMIERGHRLAPHFEALVSRSHYVDLALRTRRDYLVRIRQVVAEGMLDAEGVVGKQRDELLAFVEENAERLRELSLRMVIKLANLMRINPGRWRQLAAVTCMRDKRS